MKKIVLLEASPKVNEESVSKFLIEMAGKYIDDSSAEKTFISVRESLSKNTLDEDFESILKADALIIVFPLYIFCMPGILTRYLQDYYQFFIEHGGFSNRTRVYSIVNCGFPEPEINLEAVRVIRSFSQHINALFRFGIMIGGGGMLLGQIDAPFMKATREKLIDGFSRISKDIQTDNIENMENIQIKMNFPRWLYFFMGDWEWFGLAHKNGLRRKDLYRKPYLT